MTRLFSRVLVMGATGLVGRELLRILQQRRFPVTPVVAVASASSAGKTITVDGVDYAVIGSSPDLFRPDDLIFFTGHDDLAADLVPKAVAAGATVIDNSATFRMDPTVPLVIPEINAAAITADTRLIANPNCTTATFILPLHAIWQTWGLAFTTVASYQSISGGGTAPYNTFLDDLGSLASKASSAHPEELHGALDPLKILCNLMPIIGSVGADGTTSEERKMTHESRKILGDPTLDLVGTCVRVPTLISHATAVHCRTTRPVPSADALREAFARHPGIALMDDANVGRFPTPVQAAGTDPTWVGRIRRFDDHTVGFFAVADNLRKGAALNAVQIGELLV